MRKFLIVVSALAVGLVWAQDFYGVGVVPDQSKATDFVEQKDDPHPVIWCKQLELVSQPVSLESGKDEGVAVKLLDFEPGNKTIIAGSAKLRAVTGGRVAGAGAFNWAIGTVAVGSATNNPAGAAANIASGKFVTTGKLTNEVVAVSSGRMADRLQLSGGSVYLNVGATNELFEAAATPRVSGTVKLWYLKTD